jgi:hypothetical protein
VAVRKAAKDKWLKYVNQYELEDIASNELVVNTYSAALATKFTNEIIAEASEQGFWFQEESNNATDRRETRKSIFSAAKSKLSKTQVSGIYGKEVV